MRMYNEVREKRLQLYSGCCVMDWLLLLPLAACNQLQLCFSQWHYQPGPALRHRGEKQTSLLSMPKPHMSK